MLYKIDYTRRNDGSTGTRWMKNFPSDVEAYKRFMDDFFVANPTDAVRVDRLIEVEFTGDLSNLDEMIEQLPEASDERE